jgi:hypothetical protein
MLRSSVVTAVAVAVVAVALVLPAAPIGGTVFAQAPPPDRSAEVRAALERLPITPGTWEGEAWFRQGPGDPHAVQQVERVESRLDGVVLLIEGTGWGEDGSVVHHAFATLGWDPATEEYTMTAWLANGSRTEAEVAFAEGVLTWGFQVPSGPRIRYRIESPSAGVWKEGGEASMDGGTTWHPFFGMTLQRVEGSGR